MGNSNEDGEKLATKTNELNWMLRNFRVISSGNMLCLLCETAIPVGSSSWIPGKSAWEDSDATLETFALCALGHWVECETFNALVR